MKKLILLLIVTLLTDFALAQNKDQNATNHILFAEFGGMSFIGGTINYEYSLSITKHLSINPGLGGGISYVSYEYSDEYYFGYYPSLKIILGRNRTFFEIGIYANLPTKKRDVLLGKNIGFRYYLKESPLFFRISVNSMQNKDIIMPWIGLSIGVRI